jgi:hypothetical protein
MINKIDQDLKIENLKFSIFYGLLYGSILLINYSLIFIIYYGAIYTGMILLFYMMIQIPKKFKLKFNKELMFPKSISIGFVIFFIMTVMQLLALEFYDHYNTPYIFRKGYIYNLIEETIKQTFLLTIIFSLIFIPIYRFFKSKTSQNKEELFYPEKSKRMFHELFNLFLNLFEIKWWKDKLKNNGVIYLTVF